MRKHRFFDLVADRPALVPDGDPYFFCPAGHETTYKGFDPVKRETHWTCLECGKDYISRGLPQWVVERGTNKLVEGVPRVDGETYTWTCRHCKGDVMVERHPALGFRFRCTSCGRYVSSDTRNWKPPDNHKPYFRVEEHLGMGFCNLRGVTRLNLRGTKLLSGTPEA